MTANERLRKFRKHLGHTQEQFGKPINKTWDQIKNIEAGKLNVTPEIAKNIEQKHGVARMWLLYGEGEMIPTVEMISDREKKKTELNQLLDSLNDTDFNLVYYNVKKTVESSEITSSVEQAGREILNKAVQKKTKKQSLGAITQKDENYAQDNPSG